MEHPSEWIQTGRARPRLAAALIAGCAAIAACNPSTFVPAPPPRTTPTTSGPPLARATPSPRFDEVRTLATHNSYAMSFDGWIDAEQEASNSYILDQLLYHRVRAFELDIHPALDFSVFHTVPLYANCQKLAECLEIFMGYHRMNPEHDVITIYLHLFEPFSPTSVGSAEALDDLIRQKLGNLVYTPQQAVERCPTSSGGTTPARKVRRAVADCGWPTMAELRGKFIFAIHRAGIPGNYVRGYADSYTPTRRVFIGGLGEDHDVSTDVFVVDASAAGYAQLEAWKKEHVITREWGIFMGERGKPPIFFHHVMLNGLYNNFGAGESATREKLGLWPSNAAGWGRFPWDHNNLRSVDRSSMLPLFTWSYLCIPQFSPSSPPAYPPGCVQDEIAFRSQVPPEQEPLHIPAYWPEQTQSIWVQGRNATGDAHHYSFFALPPPTAEDPFFNLTASISAPSGFQQFYKELDTDDITDTIPADLPHKLDRGCLMARASTSPDADYLAICRHNFIDSIEVLARRKRGREDELLKFHPYRAVLRVDEGSISPESVKIFAQLEKTSPTANCYRGLVTNDGATGATVQRGLRWDASETVCFDAPLSVIGLAVRSEEKAHAGYLFGNVKRNAGSPRAAASGPTETIVSAAALRQANVGSLEYAIARDRTHLPSEEYRLATSRSPGKAELADVRRIDAGPFHTCAIVSSGVSSVGGRVKCWGDNKLGQLGDGTKASRAEPAYVRTAGGALLDRVLEISAGGDCGADARSCTPDHPQYMAHTCALVAPGPIDGVPQDRNTVWCWGANTYHQLGNDSTADSPVPVRVNTAALRGEIQSISAGGYHNCLSLVFGAPHCWGRNHKKQARNSADAAVPHPEAIALPTEGTNRRRPAIAVRAGGKHSCAVYAGMVPDFYGSVQDAPWETSPRKVVCWGANEAGQGGSSPASPLGLWTPSPADGRPMFPTQLALGSKVSVMIGTTVPYGGYQGSQLWGWGANTANMLAVDAAQLSSARPVLLGSSPTHRSTVSKDLAAGWSHVCYTQRAGAGPGADRQIWCSGTDRTPAAGEASLQRRTNPPGVGRPIELTAGVAHTCAVYEDPAGPTAPSDWWRSRIACWGDNGSGQLGVQGGKAPEPVLVPLP